MLNRNNHKANGETAGVIVYSCGILFVLFCFLFLACFQGDLIAKVQFVLSHGITRYDLVIGAAIITFVLQLLQRLISSLLFCSPGFYALTYFPSFVCLAILASISSDTIHKFSFGPWVWVAPVLLLLWVLALSFLRSYSSRNVDNVPTISGVLHSNVFLMLVFCLFVGSVTTTDSAYVREQAFESYMIREDYRNALLQVKRARRLSRHHTEMLNYSLLRLGVLPDSILSHPQNYGAAGLLDICDKDTTYRFTYMDICRTLGGVPDSTVRSTSRYLELLQTVENNSSPYVGDFLLCYCLLDGNLEGFRSLLPWYYSLHDKMPRIYKEALLLDTCWVEKRQKLSASDSICVVTDSAVIRSYSEYRSLSSQYSVDSEDFVLHKGDFLKSYWWYYEHKLRRNRK